MDFLFPLLFCLGITGTIVLLTKRKFEEVIPMALMGSVLVIYVFGLFDRIYWGFYVSIAIAAAFPILLVVEALLDKHAIQTARRYFTPGMIVFLLFYVAVFFMNYDRGLTTWDEVSHWAPMVKETLRLGKFHCVEESALAVHKQYVPGMPLFQSFWCFLSGGYKEAYLYRALQTLGISMFFPAFSSVAVAKGKKSTLRDYAVYGALILILLVTHTVFSGYAPSFYSSIYLDYFLGMVAAYCIFLIFLQKEKSIFDLIRMGISLSFLLLLKEVTICFFLLFLGIFWVNQVVLKKHNDKRAFYLQNLKAAIPAILLLMIIPFTLYKLWSVYLSVHNVNTSASSIQLPQILGIISGTSGEPYQHETFVNYVTAFFTRSMSIRGLDFTYLQLTVLITFLLAGAFQFGKTVYLRQQRNSASVLIFLGSLAYAVAIGLSYVFWQGPIMGPMLHSLERFWTSYWVFGFSFASQLFVYASIFRYRKRENKEIKKTIAICAVVFVFVLSPSGIVMPATNGFSATDIYEQATENIRLHLQDEDTLLLISQESTSFDWFAYIYLLMPAHLYKEFYFIANEEETETDVMKRWEKALAESDYIYLQNADYTFYEKFGDFFPMKNWIANEQLYKIVSNEAGERVIEFIR